MTEFVRMRSRPQADERRSFRGHSGDSETPVALIFSLTLVFLIFILGISQVTERSNALVIVRAAIASLTDIEVLIADNGDFLRQAAAAEPSGTTELSGYPIEVALSNQAIRDADDAELRALILEVAGEEVYENGPGAFAEGEQDIDLLSSENFLRFMLNQLTGDLNQITRYGSIALGALALALAFHVVRKENGHRKFTVTGLFAVAAGVVAIGITYVFGFLVGQFGGDDAFSGELREFVMAIVRVWRWDAIIVIIGGLGIALVGMAYRLLAGKPTEEAAYAEYGEYDYIDYSID